MTENRINVSKATIDENIELTIREFFVSVYTYMAKNLRLYTKESDKEDIALQGKIVDAQEKQIAGMIFDRKLSFDAYKLDKEAQDVKNAGSSLYKAFIKPGSVDNSALVAYRDVISGITDYIYYNDKPESFLEPLKRWNYVISNRKGKNLIYPFLPLKHFVVKGKGQR